MLAAVLAYLPAQLGLEYVWDDWQLFINDPALRMPDTALEALTRPILPGTTYFRPLPLASMAAEFLTVGLNPAVSHGANLLLHALNTLLVGWIAIHLTSTYQGQDRSLRVLLASLIYAVHPALIEPVAWVAGRFDLMVTFFMLAAIWGSLALQGWPRMAWVGCMFFLAALSKEMAATLPLILALLYLHQKNAEDTWASIWRRFWTTGEWKLYATLFIIGLAYLALRAYFMGHISHQDDTVAYQFEGPLHHLAFVGQTVLFYLKMTFWPFADISPQHPLSPADLGQGQRLLGWLASVSLTIMTVLAIASRRSAALLFAAYVIALLPVLNIIPLTIGGNIGHERFLAMPLALFALCFSLLHAPERISPAMHRTLPILTGVMIIAWLAFAVVNIRITLPLWTNEYSLWSWAYAKHPESGFVRFSYAAAAIRYGHLKQAGESLQSVNLNQEHFKNENEIYLIGLKGLYLSRTQRYQEALEYYQKAEKSFSFLSHRELEKRGTPLITAQIVLGNARQWFFQFLYTGIAEANNALRDFDQALKAANIALFYAPRYPSAWMSKAFALYGLDQPTAAEEAFQKAISYFTPQGQQDALHLRKQFLDQLCTLEEHLETCRRNHTKIDTSPTNN
jgi:hypothetical protein